MKPVNAKRVYDPTTFFSDIGFLGVRLLAVIDAYKSKRIPWPFAEKIMLATTAVNDCTYCARIHTQLAKTSGVPETEILQLLHSEIDRSVEAYEYHALCFAQHYAESNRQPDPKEVEELIGFYGDRKANDIMLYVRLIFVGNLTGNTFDALLSRLQGKPHPDSRWWFEGMLIFIAVPLIAIAGLPLVGLLTLLSYLIPGVTRLAPQSHLPMPATHP